MWYMESFTIVKKLREKYEKRQLPCNLQKCEESHEWKKNGGYISR